MLEFNNGFYSSITYSIKDFNCKSLNVVERPNLPISERDVFKKLTLVYFCFFVLRKVSN